MNGPETIPYGSLCSGMEMASQALEPIGYEPAFVAEIEAFPCGVMGYRIGAGRPRNPIDPDTMPTEKLRKQWAANNRELERMAHRGAFGNRVVNEGDFTKIRAADYPNIKLLIGGPPCQDFSIAGKRAGLDGDRGNLTLSYVELVLALFATGSLRVAAYENVPGLLSDKKNAFGCFLGALVGHDAPIVSPHGQGRWTDAGMVVGPRARAAWRVLDAQHFGLAQRRRRLFVIICPLDGPDPARILFEPEGVFRPAPEGSSQGQDIASTVAGGAHCRGGNSLDDASAVAVVAPTIRAGGNTSGGHRPPGTDVDTIDSLVAVYPITADALRGEGIALTPGADAGGHVRLRNPSLGIGEDGDPASTIQAGAPPAVAVAYAIRTNQTGANSSNVSENLAYPTLATESPQAVAYSIMPMNSGKDFVARVTEIAQPVMAGGPVGGNQGGDYIVQPVGFAAIGHSEYAEGVAPLRSTGGDFGGGSETIIAFNSREDLVHSTKVFGALGSSHPQAQAQAVCYAPELSPTLKADGFDGSEDGSGRRALVAHAFSVRGRDGEAQIEAEAGDLAPAVRTGTGGSSKSFVATVDGAIRWAVRRLMPPECETLQGSKEIKECLTITVDCSDRPNAVVTAALLCRKSPSNALPAGEDSSARNAERAEPPFNTSREPSARPVVAHVLIDLERSRVQLSRLVPYISNASSAAVREQQRLLPLGDAFAQFAAEILGSRVLKTPDGKAALPPSMTPSTPRRNGRPTVTRSGAATGERVGGVETSTAGVLPDSMSTTSEHGSTSQPFASTLETQCSSVVHAIASFIPEAMSPGNSFAVSVTIKCGYTRIPWRGKPAEECPDGPRYKVIGNSFPEPIIRWLGVRIKAEFNRIDAERIAA